MSPKDTLNIWGFHLILYGFHNKVRKILDWAKWSSHLICGLKKKLVFLNHSAVKTVKKYKYIREIVHSKHHSKLNFFSILQHYMFKKPLDFIFSIKIIRNRSAEWWWTFFLASYKLIFDTIPFFLLVAHIHKKFFYNFI